MEIVETSKERRCFYSSLYRKESILKSTMPIEKSIVGKYLSINTKI